MAKLNERKRTFSIINTNSRLKHIFFPFRIFNIIFKKSYIHKKISQKSKNPARNPFIQKTNFDKSKKIGRKNRPRFKFLLVYWGFVIVLVSILILFVSKNVVVNEVVCTENGSECETFIKTLVNDAVGKNPNSAMKLISNRLSEQKYLEDFSVRYNFPDKVVVVAVKRSPVLAFNNGSSWMAEVDSEGYVTGLVDNSQLRVVVVDENFPNPGNRVNPHLFFALALIRGIDKISEADKAKIQNNYFVVKPKNENINFVFPLDGDVSYLVGSYSLLLSRLNNPIKESTIEKSEISEIDLRYRYPVIRRIKTVEF